MTFWKRQNSGDSKKVYGCQEFKGAGRRDGRIQHRGYFGQWNYSVWHGMVGTCSLHLSKYKECTVSRLTLTKVYSDDNNQYRVIEYCNYTALVGDVDSGGGCAYGARG